MLICDINIMDMSIAIMINVTAMPKCSAFISVQRPHDMLLLLVHQLELRNANSSFQSSFLSY